MPGAGNRDPIPLALAEVTDADIAAVLEVLRSGRLSRGPAEGRFERRVARAVGVPHAIAVNSGTSALHLGLRALGVGAGDEVITTPYSFIASAAAILYLDAVPVFVDVDPLTLNVDPERVAVAVTRRTRAILPVHVYGRPAPMPALREIAAAHGVPILEDACEALGSQSGGIRAGALGDIGTLSFYPNKQVTTGEGGVLTTASAALAGRLRSLRNQGRVATEDGFDQDELGYSYRMPETSCALGASQLERLDALVGRRERIVAAYRERLGAAPGIELPPLAAPDERISWFVFVVLLAPEMASQRDRVLAGMREQSIECERYFAPIHLQPLYRRRFGYRGGEFPVAESAGRRALALPFFTSLTEPQIDRVCQTLLQLICG